MTQSNNNAKVKEEYSLSGCWIFSFGIGIFIGSVYFLDEFIAVGMLASLVTAYWWTLMRKIHKGERRCE